MPQAATSIRIENPITPPAPAWALPTLNLPLISTAARSPPPISSAISAEILIVHGRSPGSSGASVARTAALRASERLGGGVVAELRGVGAGGEVVADEREVVAAAGEVVPER